MIYPFDFEAKIGFDRIRSLLSDRCLSPMGREKVSQIRFLTSLDHLKPVLDATFEFQLLLKYEEGFPSDHYYEMAECLNSIRVEGTFPEIREIFDLKRSLETVRSIVAFFRTRKENKYVVLSELCSSVKIYPFVIESIDRIIDRFGEIKDNASPKLKEIRSQSASKRSRHQDVLHQF